MQRMVQPGGIGHASTSDTVKSKSKRPCLVVRPAVSILDAYCTVYSFSRKLRALAGAPASGN